MKRFIKRNIKLLILLTFIIIIGAVGITFALKFIFNPTSVSGTAADVEAVISYAKDNNEEDITSITSSGDLFPTTIDTNSISNVNNSDKVIKFEFGVTGVSTNPNNSVYDIALVNLDIDCELKNTAVKWVLYKNNTLLYNGNFSNTFDSKVNNKMLLTTTQQDLTTTKDNYLLVIYIEDSNNINNDQSIFLGKSLSADIRIETAVSSTKKTLTRSTSSDASCTGNDTSVTKLECADNLVYDSTTLNLIKNNTVPTGVTVNQSTATLPGDYTITAKLSSGYKWSDDSTEDYVFTCSINKRQVTIKSLDQVEGSFVSNPTQAGNNINTTVDATNLVTGHVIDSIKLTRIVTNDGDDVITPSKAVIKSGNTDVTNNYIINYQSLGKITSAS